MSHLINENDKSYKPIMELIDEAETFIVDKEALKNMRFMVVSSKEDAADHSKTDPNWVDYESLI